MTLQEFIKKAVGVPFKPHGRGYDNWDCWGLIYIAHRDVYSIDLPSYDKEYKSINREREKIEGLYSAGKQEEWVEVKDPQAGDVVMLYMDGRAVHVGLMIDKDKFLHTEQGIDTCVQRLTDFQFRIEGFYRYNGKCVNKN